MTDNKVLVAKRKRVYERIKSEICSRRNVPANPSDAQLADALGGKIELTDSLRFLKEGTHNPTNRLVTAFKREFGLEIPEDIINAFLVDPFKNA